MTQFVALFKRYSESKVGVVDIPFKLLIGRTKVSPFDSESLNSLNGH